MEKDSQYEFSDQRQENSQNIAYRKEFEKKRKQKAKEKSFYSRWLVSGYIQL